MKYQHANALLNTKQGQTSVDDYCAKMQRLAREISADDAMLRFAVINGLRPEIRNHVTHAQPTTWEGLVSSARVGEMCVPVPPIQDVTVAAQFELIQLRQLQSDKTKSKNAGSTSSVVGDRRSKSPPPRRVRFENEYVKTYVITFVCTTDNRRPFSGYGQGVVRERGFREFRRGRGHGNGPPTSQ